MELLSYFLFALALNIDSFVAGMAYGARQIKIPLLSLLIISLISVAAISVSMTGGKMLLPYIPEVVAHRAGGILLLLIGIWVLFQTRRAEQTGKEEDRENGVTRLIRIHIRPLGLVIQILKEPVRADQDSSGAISPREAILLGTALAMDAFAAGFAVSLLDSSIVYTALVVGLGHFLLTYTGIVLGNAATARGIGRHVSILPGCILILLGLYKIY
ncbi:MAG: manganese efflux pump MntP [Firmicutes bacterium ADurb.Bin456]|nr:MAG: manganese efflux pump MntP [Firmicutes bacterium ADurb.Bin456]